MVVDPGLAEGRSRLTLFVGVLGLATATWISDGRVAWASLAVIVVAFALNTAGKVRHYGECPIDRRQRGLLVATWTLQSLLAVAVLVQFVALRYGGGQGQYVWALAVGAIGFALLHRAAQSTYLGELETPDATPDA